VTWFDAIKAALISIPKIIDALSALGARMDALVEASRARQLQEVRNEQRNLERLALTLKDDQARADFVRRLSELKRRM